MEFKTTTIKDIPIHFVKTKQFKSMQIEVRFFDDLDADTVTARHLMLAMLKAKTQQYSTRKQLSKHLESLYDTHLSAQSMKLGKKHINQFVLTFPNPKYTQQSLLDAVIDLLDEILFNPAFDQTTLDEEKQFLHDYFAAEYANKTRYAAKRYYEHMYKGHPYNVNALGVETNITDVGLEDIKLAYSNMINNNPVLISVSGDFDEKDLVSKLSELPFSQGKALPKDLFIRHDFKTLNDVKETMELSQDRLFMAIKSDIYFKDDDYFILNVFNALFGEGSEAMLFQEVRENQSLAYYIHSSYAPFSSLITVVSGMDDKNIEKAKAIIKEILSNIQSGHFDEEALELAKKHRISLLKKSYDNIRSLSLKGLRNALFDVPFDEQRQLEAYQAVSKRDIMRVAQKLRIVFSYVLGSDDHGKD